MHARAAAHRFHDRRRVTRRRRQPETEEPMSSSSLPSSCATARSSRTWRRAASLSAMTEDLVETVIELLTPSDLRRAMDVCRDWRRMCTSDGVWRRLCERRWRLERPRAALAASGTDDFCELYAYLDRNGVMPRGKFTTKHQLVWGKSRQEGADVWMTIAHRPDCRLPSMPGPRGGGRRASYVELRIVVQNLDDRPLTVALREVKVQWKDGPQGRVLGLGADDNAPAALAPRLVARNGEEHSEGLVDGRLRLEVLEFAVVSICVDCDDGEFEADFLERCSALWLPIRRPGPCATLTTCRCGLIPDNYHHGSIRVPVVDESVIWKHYRSVSGRFMVLDARAASWKQPHGLCGEIRPAQRTTKAMATTTAPRKSSAT